METGGWRADLTVRNGGGGERQELEGTDSVGARKAGEPWKGMGLLQLQTAEAPKGPGAGDIEGPPGFGRPETETPQNTRPEGGAGDNPQG